MPAAVRRPVLPNSVLALAVPGDDAAGVFVPLLACRATVAGKSAAYVCRGFVCRMPVAKSEGLEAALEQR